MSGLVSFSPYLLGVLLVPLLITMAFKDTYLHWTLWGRALIAGGGMVLAILLFPENDVTITSAHWRQYLLCAGSIAVATGALGELTIRHPRLHAQPWSTVVYPVSVAILTLAAFMMMFACGILIRFLFV
jgi:hypothetical protein